jgi:hypothetical protein
VVAAVKATPPVLRIGWYGRRPRAAARGTPVLRVGWYGLRPRAAARGALQWRGAVGQDLGVVVAIKAAPLVRRMGRGQHCGVVDAVKATPPELRVCWCGRRPRAAARGALPWRETVSRDLVVVVAIKAAPQGRRVGRGAALVRGGCREGDAPGAADRLVRPPGAHSGGLTSEGVRR